jgi:hypothetical protein
MKTTVCLFGFLFTVIMVNGQVQSECTVPSELAYHWLPDIRHLALCRMYEIQSPDTVFVRIPAVHCDSVAEGMAAIVNARYVIPEADSVFNIYCIHNIYGCVNSSYHYLVAVDTSYSWTESWQNMQTMTGNPLMDTMITRYSLTLVDFYYWSSSCVASLWTDSIWNMFALSDSLALIDGVMWSEPSSGNMDDDKIDYFVINGERFFDFSMEWGDCMAGCTSYYAWKFKVNPDCVVTYLGFEANVIDPFPSPVYCNFFSVIKDQDSPRVLIYPNPSSTKITVIIPEVNGNARIAIFDVDGKNVLEQDNIEAETPLDISALPRGVYFVRVKDERQVLITKLIKQ